ncbi:hypothetical protein OG562_39440 [Streptomyces sp. NBC_01275]|uniref:hypothetical protein n=1 Tax=Streptomyces sp. NBC_01275 TaxID=2903807 RepID=UPI0022516835|nr:hypothetical protein [Streptomyces sp. NBC_01275]MCX4766942.1 hypothetical protein [Streptomyces sp. NBC_01275]
MTGVELLTIDENTTSGQFAKEIRWNAASTSPSETEESHCWEIPDTSDTVASGERPAEGGFHNWEAQPS